MAIALGDVEFTRDLGEGPLLGKGGHRSLVRAGGREPGRQRSEDGSRE